jgi:hypothetical protein
MCFLYDIYEMIEFFFDSLFQCFFGSGDDDDLDTISHTTRNPINPHNFKADDIYPCKQTF